MPSQGEIHQLQQRLLTDTVFWAAHCATILTTRKRPVKLEARPWQKHFDDALNKQRDAGQPMRALILKARKLGFSTWTQARIMQRVTQNPYHHAITVAHRRDASQIMYSMAKLIYERLPTDAELAELIYGDPDVPAPFSVRPDWLGGTESKGGGGYMVLGDKQRKWEASVYETMTAGSKGIGRSYTPLDFHGSEVAHYEDQQSLGGALSSVPLEDGTMIVLESTANGFNHFFDMWETAERGAEDPETGGLYVPLFYGWQDNPLNRREFVSEQARERFERTLGDPGGGGDEEEIDFYERGVELEQLFWRRSLLHSVEFNHDLEYFHQEHPATPEQAFIGSGQPVFPGILVSRAIEAAKAAPEPVRGVLRGLEFKERRTRSGSVLVPQRALWVPSEGASVEDRGLWGFDHHLRVWEHPVNGATQADAKPHEIRPDGQYVVFVDVALGQGATFEERDWHAIQVLDHMTRLQVASYRSRIPLHDLPLVVLLVGLYYNGAWIAPEVNGPGIAVVDVLAKDFRYPRIYRRHRAGDDRRQDARESLLGWQTDLRTKPLMEQTFGQALKEGTHGLRCVETAREGTTYVQDPKNAAKHGARPGTHDDLLMAVMGAHRVASELKPRVPGAKKPQRRWIADDVTGY
jgi:hypothetical protein